jgi:MFS transporter, ACDE family, multidrug resistance protein
MREKKRGERADGSRPVWKDHNLHVIWGVTLMAVLGSSSVSPAFPKVVAELGVSPGQVGLLITVFTLPGVFLTPVAGVLSDKFGRKSVLIPSLLLFGVAGGACALARDFELLLGLRVLQGVGAAALGATNVTLIGDLFAGRERTAALGYNSSVLSTGTASYPAIGGALATFGWYYPFALPLLAIPIAFLVLFSLHNPEPHNEQGLKEYARSIWSAVKDRTVAGLFAGSLVTFILLFGPLIVYLPILMDQAFGVSPLVIGVVVASTSLTTALTSTQIGNLTSRFSEKTLVRASFVLYAAALALVAFVPYWWLLFVPTVIFGVAQSLNLPNVFSLLNEAAPDENRGAFLALNSTILRLGQTLGPVLMAVIAAPLGLAGAYLAAGALAVAMFVLALALIR